MTKALTRNQVVKIIKDKIYETYGDAPMSEVIRAEGWNELARHYLKPTCQQPLPKKLLEFGGVEIVPPPKTKITYRRKEK